MKVKYKFWFESEKGYTFGKGAYELLRNIEKYENLRKGAEELGMSYRHAWGIIQEIEKNLNKKIVESKRGGSKGGITILTNEGVKLIKEYEKYEKIFNYAIKEPYIKPSIAVDAILVENNKILLVKRGREPFKGSYALPGGFVEYGEKVEDAVIREVREETGLEVEISRLFGVYSDPKRDPRGHTISIVFEVKRKKGKIKGGDDATYAAMLSLSSLPNLAFDHSMIIRDYLLFLSRI